MASQVDGHSYRCRECNRHYSQGYRTANLQHMLEYLGGEWACQVCGITSPHGHRFFDWHHIDPTKKTKAVSSLSYKLKWKDLKKEVIKCLFVCPNCHTNIHLEELGGRGR